MAKLDKFTQSPLLYIVQPTERVVEANMQSFASHKKAMKKESVATSSEQVNKEETDAVEDKHNERKSFKDMTIAEKLAYLTRLPNQMPKMKCEIIAGEKKYRGIVLQYDENIVTLKTFQRPSRVEIPFEDISDIKLKGF